MQVENSFSAEYHLSEKTKSALQKKPLEVNLSVYLPRFS
jgi:hypothetical protein